jgi:predicted HicB family RNase H-like nuclease
MAADTQTITVRLPKDLYEQLRKVAFDQRTSMNAIIVDALRKQQDKPRRAKT